MIYVVLAFCGVVRGGHLNTWLNKPLGPADQGQGNLSIIHHQLNSMN
jgi:hypothetical protein